MSVLLLLSREHNNTICLFFSKVFVSQGLEGIKASNVISEGDKRNLHVRRLPRRALDCAWVTHIVPPLLDRSLNQTEFHETSFSFELETDSNRLCFEVFVSFTLSLALPALRVS